MDIETVNTSPFAGQRPGTSGLRKKVREFSQAGYLENFVQSVFDVVPELKGGTLVCGGDGRYFNAKALQIICNLALANGVSTLIVGKNGLLSTPAVSCLIRERDAQGGLVLSASHNPGGPDEDFGIKYNIANGGPAPESVTEKIYLRSQDIYRYFYPREPLSVDLSKIQSVEVPGKSGKMRIEIVDSVSDYAQLMSQLFDFDLISERAKSRDLRVQFDAMHAVTGPYATRILKEQLGFGRDSLRNAKPSETFGGGHPDPNLTVAHELVTAMNSPGAADLGAASDGDGDRNMILGANFFVTPSDSLAVMAANASVVKGYQKGLAGVARSMPTSKAVDAVANAKGIDCYETPTGWKYFGNLLDAGKITLCGEESFGTGSDHVREKDGLWAVLFWLNVLAVRKQSVEEIVRSHWAEFGRNYYSRHDYEGVDADGANALMSQLREQLASLAGTAVGNTSIAKADDFAYVDPIDGSEAERQGIRLMLEGGGRIIYRLSGTGTVGATLRVYLESPESDSTRHTMDTAVALQPLAHASKQIARIEHFVDRREPSVIT